MSYPGPVGYSTNLGCDTGLQRATDQFNFVVDNGGAEPAPTVPTSLQSPATITPAVDGSVSLTMAATAGNSGLSITSPNTSSVIVNGGADAVMTLATIGSAAVNTSGIFLNSSGGNDENFIHFSDPTALGIAVYNKPGTPGQLSIGNDTTNANVASFNQTTNVCNLGNPLNAGAIYLNNTTTVTSSASRPPVGGVVLTQTGATTSNISQQVNAGGGVLTLGATVANPDVIFIGDPGGSPNTAYVDITGGTSGTTGLRLQGGRGGVVDGVISTNQTGISANLQITSGFADATPNMAMNGANTTLNNIILLPNTLSFVGTGSIAAFRTLQTNGVVCGDNSTATIPNPSGLVTGLFLILARGSGGSAGNPACSVSTISFFNGGTWSWGGGGCAPALVSAPPSYIGIQGAGASLILANGGGLGTVTMDFIFLQLGGSLGI